MSELLIRDARSSDADAIREVTLAAYHEYANQMSEIFWDAYRWNILATLAEVEGVEQLVAEDGGTVVGTTLLYPPRRVTVSDELSLDNPWPEVRLLAVAPTARGRGIGLALMQECVGRARQSGAPALSLHTTAFMVAAAHMYEQMGFVAAPQLDFEPAPGFTIKGYRLDLER